MTIDLREGDLLEPVADVSFDLVIANLPYVGADDLVDQEVSGFEPALAVFAADQGRALIERLVDRVGDVLAAGGLVALEVGAGQASWAVERLRTAGLEDAASEPDLAGVERLAFARRSSP